MANAYDVLNTAVEDAAASSNALSDNVVNRWLNPGYAQRIEFGQQVALQQQQNDWQSAENAKWNDEREKMKRLKEAGVNPLTAAQGVAGAGASPTSPTSVSSPTQAGQPNLPDAVNSVGNVVDRLSSAQERNSLLEDRRKNLISDTYLKYKEAGFADEQAKGLAIANAFLPTEKFLGILTMTANMDKIKGEYQSLMQGIDESKKRIEELDSQIRLNEAQGNLAGKLAAEAEKRSLLIEAQTTELNWFNDKRKELGIDPRSPLENQIFMLGITGDARYESALGIVRDVKYNESLGGYNADKQTAYDRAYEAGRAAYDFNWDSPPKTIAEFLWKGVGNIKENLSEIVSDLFKPSSDKPDKSVEPSKDDLRQSYLRYRQGLDTQYAMLNMMRSELADRLAAGENQSQTVDLRMEINKLNAELSKMPQTFDDFKKYVKKYR